MCIAASAGVVLVLAGCAGGDDPVNKESVEDESVNEESVEDETTDDERAEEEPAEDKSAEDDENEEDVFVAELTMVPRSPEMDGQDGVGAASSAEYFMFAYTYAYGTGDTEPFAAMSGPECGWCASVMESAAGYHTPESYMRSGDPEILGTDYSDSPEPQWDYLVQTQVRMPEMRVYNASHEVTEVHQSQDLVVTLGMVYDGEIWVAAGVGTEELE